MFALAVAYPVLVHLAVLWPRPWLEWLALAALSALVLYPALRARRPWAWVVLAACLVASGLIVHWQGARWILLVPPIAIPLSLLIVFASSLRPGQQPLVTRFALMARGSLPPELITYTRQVTILWVVVLAGLTLSAILLTLFAAREVWSLATNFVHYLVIGAVFAGEYLFRRWRFRHLEHPGFFAYLRQLKPVRLRSS
jgi:uncharacterized membrane protein